MTENKPKETPNSQPKPELQIQPKDLRNRASTDEKIDALFDILGNTQQEAMKTLIGEKNRDVKDGNSLIHKSRIISGNYNRVAILFGFLDKLGITCDSERSDIFGATIGFSLEIAPNGLRGEIIEFGRPSQPKKEQTQNNNQNQNGNNQPLMNPQEATQ